MHREPYALGYVPDNFKTQKMRKKATEEDPWQLHTTPDRFKNQEMCDKVVEAGQYQLKDVHDWFVTDEEIKIWRDDNNYCNDHELIKWYKRYQK